MPERPLRHFYLVDDGTLDTVFVVELENGSEEELRYSQEFVSDYRNPKTGRLSPDFYRIVEGDAEEIEVDEESP